MTKLLRYIIISLGLLLCTTLCRAQTWSLSTNLPDWCAFGTLNIEGSAAVSRHWSVHLGAEYNPWTFNAKPFNDKKITAEAGVRWWAWHVYSGWWTQVQLQYREYNRGGLISKKTEEGDAGGLSLAAGYTLMLSKHFNIEFGAGFWAGGTTYTVYACPRCGRTIDSGTKFFVLPDELSVALVWTF